MNLTEEKAKLEAQLEAITKQITELEWTAKTLKAKVRKFEKVIQSASEILKPSDQ